MQQMVPVCRERVLPALWHTSERAGIALSPDALLFAAFLHCALCTVRCAVCNVQCAVSNARNWPPLFPLCSSSSSSRRIQKGLRLVPKVRSKSFKLPQAKWPAGKLATWPHEHAHQPTGAPFTQPNSARLNSNWPPLLVQNSVREKQTRDTLPPINSRAARADD